MLGRYTLVKLVKIKNLFSSILKSPIAQYIGIRYLTYGLQFVNAILIAKYLGVFYFGIYSFLLLINQYLTYVGITPSYSLNAILSTKKSDELFSKNLWNNALFLNILIIGFILFTSLTIIVFFPVIFSKFLFKEYIIYVLFIFALSSLNNLFINLYRTYGLLQKINFNQLIVPAIQFFVMFFAKEKELLSYLLLGTISANLLSLILFLHKIPLNGGIAYKKEIFLELLKRGFHLLLYNVSFYLILLSSRTIVSIYYTTEELGLYTLAVNLSSAVFMVVGAFSFVLYPKFLNKFFISSNTVIKNLLFTISSIYITGCYLLTYLGFFAIPLVKYLLPQYETALPAFKVLLLTQLILNNNFGYSLLLVARKKERFLTKYALITLTITLITSIIFTHTGLPLITMALAVLIGFLFYNINITKQAFIEISQKVNIKIVLNEIFPVYYLLPILIMALSIIINDDYYFPILSFVIFSIMNKGRILNFWQKMNSILIKKDYLTF